MPGPKDDEDARAAFVRTIENEGSSWASRIWAAHSAARGRAMISGRADRGEVHLRGFDDPIRLHEVRWEKNRLSEPASKNGHTIARRSSPDPSRLCAALQALLRG